MAFDEAGYEHKVVVFWEADSIPDDGPAASAIRALAEDSEMAYDVVEKDARTGKFVTRHIRKRGPTGLVTTSTKSLAPQLGTRVLEDTLSDDPDQTRAVMLAHAHTVHPQRARAPDEAPFLALQRYLALAEVRDGNRYSSGRPSAIRPA